MLSSLAAISLFSATAFSQVLVRPNNEVVAPAALVLRATPAPTLTKCNADNCLRVMTNTPSVASSFCSTFLQPTTYITITPTVTISGSATISSSILTSASALIVPTHISQQCVLTTAPPLVTRLSSACNCLHVTPSSGTVTSTVYASATTTTVSTASPSSSPFICQDDSLPSSTYTTNGETFDLTCNVYYFVANGDDIIYGQNDITTCIDSCSTILGCIGISWVELAIDDPENECGILYNINQGGGTGSFASALIAGYPGSIGD